MKILLSIGTLLTVGMMAVGCATPQSPELKRAQVFYSKVASEPSATRYSPDILHQAREALDQAQNADNLRDQRHFAYLARQRLELARVNARKQQTKVEVARLQEQQEDFLMTLRAREAEQAQKEAEQARQALRAYRAQRNRQKLERARSELETLRGKLSDMESRETDAGLVLSLSGDVVFEFDKWELKSGAKRGLERISRWLQQHPDRRVLVEGFTDSVGGNQYNQRLSERRALAVAKALYGDGIPLGRITTRGLGEQYPVATNASSAGRQRNRRVEITILNPDSNVQDAGRGNGST
jgi:outer membrane protein OmpA-like peptidoglycan-associated protein